MITALAAGSLEPAAASTMTVVLADWAVVLADWAVVLADWAVVLADGGWRLSCCRGLAVRRLRQPPFQCPPQQRVRP